MTPEQGRGLQALKRIADDAIARMPRDDARSFIDGLEHHELADLMEAASAAGVATGTGGNLLYESAASRLRMILKLEDELAALRRSYAALQPLSSAELLAHHGFGPESLTPPPEPVRKRSSSRRPR